MEGIKQKLLEALVAADKGLDPVREGLGMDPYYPNIPIPKPRPQRMPDPTMNPNKVGMGDIRYEQGEDDRVNAARQEMDARYGLRNALYKQADQMRLDTFDRQNAPQRAPVGMYAGTTSDEVAAALPRQRMVEALTKTPPSVSMAGTTSDQVAEALPKQYQIKRGDTLSKIAKALGMTVEELAQLNDIKDVNRIYAGDTLRLA